MAKKNAEGKLRDRDQGYNKEMFIPMAALLHNSKKVEHDVPAIKKNLAVSRKRNYLFAEELKHWGMANSS